MIDYEIDVLSNGLRLITYLDRTSPFVYVNMLYRVGSINDMKHKTGLAHLFEHLMFTGTPSIPDYDKIVQKSGGDNNAFTNQDFTDYHCFGFHRNLEPLLHLEADRMNHLVLDDEEVEIQQKVVIEEFYESCLDEPFGDMWHHLCPMIYGVHPYSWPVIGIDSTEISRITIDDCKDFYQKYYHPSNASLTIGGNFDPDSARDLVEKWFSPIKTNSELTQGRLKPIKKKPASNKTLINKSPCPAIFMAFPLPNRLDPSFYSIDLISDILASGKTSRLYKRLISTLALCSEVDCYTNDVVGSGMLIIEATLVEGAKIERVEVLIWEALNRLKTKAVTEYELKKVKYKTQAMMDFAENSTMNIALNLSYFDYIGDIALIQKEYEFYSQVSIQDIQKVAIQIFDPLYCQVLAYH